MQKKIEKLNISSLEAKELIKVSKNIDKDYKKLLKGYPIQYLIGYVNFNGLIVKIDNNTLIPRYETELLVEKTLNYLKKLQIKNPKILDLCTGCGCIALYLKKNINAQVTASDISLKALRMAKLNSKINNLKIDIIKSNLFKKINDKYDLIISNPPYVKIGEKVSKVVKYEPKKALYAKDNGNYFIKKIIKESKHYINKKSIIALETNSYNKEEIKKYAKKIFPDAKIIIEKDLNNKNRYLFIINE